MTHTEAQQDKPKRLSELCKESPSLHNKIVDLVLAGPVYEPDYMPLDFALIEQKESENEKQRHKQTSAD